MTRLADTDFPADSLTTPPCPHFEECGSCQLQHLTEAAYRAWKEEQYRKLCAENGLVPHEWKPSAFIPAGARRRVVMTAYWENDVIHMGFNKFHAHDYVSIKTCLLLTPQIQHVVDMLPQALVGILARGSSMDIMVQDVGDGIDCVMTGITEQGGKQTGRLATLAESCGLRRISFRDGEREKPQVQIALGGMQKTAGALKIDIPPASFLQPSTTGEDALVAAVLDGLKGIGKRDKVADLFAGCGTFAGRILEKAAVHAIEGDAVMADALIKAAGPQAKFSAEQRDLFKEPVTVRELRDYRAVVIDPPRAGAKEQMAKLAKSAVERIVSVSCNPATFARDAKILMAGGYKLVSLQMIDQFTWSTHVEVVGVFSR